MSVSLVHLRRLIVVAVGLAIASVALPAGTAAADQSYSYSTPGTYSLTVPQYAASVNVIASGASGTNGGSTASATGGTAGNGSVLDANIAIGAGSSFAPGDSLEIVVGAQGGGGGSGGNGNEVGVGGGGGGADSVVSDLSTGNMLGVAGGGGGGGGGAGGSIFASGANGNLGTAGSAGNGSVSLDFTIADVAPTITSPTSASVPSASGSFNLQLTASGNPASTFAIRRRVLAGAQPPHRNVAGKYPPQDRGAVHIDDHGRQRHPSQRHPAVHPPRHHPAARVARAGDAQGGAAERVLGAVGSGRRDRALCVVARERLVAGGAVVELIRGDLGHTDHAGDDHGQGQGHRQRHAGHRVGHRGGGDHGRTAGGHGHHHHESATDRRPAPPL